MSKFSHEAKDDAAADNDNNAAKDARAMIIP